MVICTVPNTTSEASRNHNHNSDHTAPGPRPLQAHFQYQAPDPSIFSDLLSAGLEDHRDDHIHTFPPAQKHGNITEDTEDTEDTMGSSNSKVSSQQDFKYVPTNPDILQLPREQPEFKKPDGDPEYVYKLFSSSAFCISLRLNTELRSPTGSVSGTIELTQTRML